MSKKLELRLAPAEGTQLYGIFDYLIRNPHLVGDGRGKAADAITAFWLPFALEHQGTDSDRVRKVAQDCIHILEQQIFLVQRAFQLEGTAYKPVPLNEVDRSSEPSPEVGVGSIDQNLLFDDE